MKKAISEPPAADRQADLDALEALPDDRIDTSDIPEQADWPDAARGLFYRPVKQQITLRLDADVVAWFKRQAAGAIGPQSTGPCGGMSSGVGPLSLYFPSPGCRWPDGVGRRAIAGYRTGFSDRPGLRSSERALKDRRSHKAGQGRDATRCRRVERSRDASAVCCNFNTLSPRPRGFSHYIE